jgi:ADP-heptose:LPS heptosyltransferase
MTAFHYYVIPPPHDPKCFYKFNRKIRKKNFSALISLTSQVDSINFNLFRRKKKSANDVGRRRLWGYKKTAIPSKKKAIRHLRPEKHPPTCREGKKNKKGNSGVSI